MRTENQINSWIEALKDAIRREIIKDYITTDKNRDINSKVEESPPRSNKHKTQSQVSSLIEER
jgi:hypothetical protein